MKRAIPATFAVVALATSGFLLPSAAAHAQGRAASSGQYVNAVVATVDDEIITLQDVDNQIPPVTFKNLARQYQGEQLERQLRTIRKNMVQSLVDNELLYADFKAKGYKLPTELVRKRLDSIIQAETGGNREQFEKKLFDRGTTITEYEQKVRKMVAVDLLVDELVRRPAARLSPTEIRAYYDQHPEEFANPGRYHLAMIFLPATGRYADKMAETRGQIEKLLAEKADFAWLAKQFSEGPNAETGGDLGWMKAADLQAEMTAVVTGLAPGAVSPAVETKAGVAYLKMLELEAAQAEPFTPELARKIEGKLRQAVERKRYQEYVDRVRLDHHVKFFE